MSALRHMRPATIAAYVRRCKLPRIASIVREIVGVLTPRERLLLLGVDPFACRRCGREVEPVRRCWANPTCEACLPPPPPLPVVYIGSKP